jgi:hypothetical protein
MIKPLEAVSNFKWRQCVIGFPPETSVALAGRVGGEGFSESFMVFLLIDPDNWSK